MAHKVKGVRGTLSQAQQGLFSKGTNFFGNSSRVSAPYKEMMIGQEMKSGPSAKRKWRVASFADSRNMELPRDYKGVGKHRTKNGIMTKKAWSAFGNSEIIHLKDLKQMVLQMTIAAHQMAIAAQHYRFVLAQRALKIFQDSFELKKFNSAGEARWVANSTWTVRKRKRKRTWPGANKLLQEYNKLYQSVQYVPAINAFTSGVRANASYAGFHNDPRPGENYGNGWGGRFSPPKPVIRRQFMGHSTLLEDFINTYEKAYLFDTVFRRPT